MSQLIILRQRIHAIETIKKITHAMRLIAMSTHTHLKGNHHSFQSYINHLKVILAKIQSTGLIKKEKAEHPISHQPKKVLICIISSQKGLCGTFNNLLLNHIKKNSALLEQPETSFFLIGKKIIDSFPHQYKSQVIQSEPHFSTKNIQTMVDSIQSYMNSFDTIIIMHNVLKNFFVQETRITTIMPLEASHDHEIKQSSLDEQEYLWETDAQELFESLMKYYKKAVIEYILSQSLLAEHAARFVAMDNATRNAHTLLEEKKLEYNKLRQAKITKELTELSSIFTL